MTGRSPDETLRLLVRLCARVARLSDELKAEREQLTALLAELEAEEHGRRVEAQSATRSTA